MTMITKYKHVDSAVDMGVDFARRLTGAETLASAPTLSVISTSPDVAGTADDPVISNIVITGTQVVARITGGTAAENVAKDRWETRYVLEATVVTSSGETESEIVELVTYDGVERT